MYNKHKLHTPENKNLEPCWFFNQPGGCTKTAKECVYTHVLDPHVRKPLHLQHPCYHLHVKGECKNIDLCINDHKYELRKNEWETHFKEEYPGPGYLNKKKNEKQFKSDNYFQILSLEVN
jgi:hypothetical protein